MEFVRIDRMIDCKDQNASRVNCEGKWVETQKNEDKCGGRCGLGGKEGEGTSADEVIEWLWSNISATFSLYSHPRSVSQDQRQKCFRTRWQARMPGGGGGIFHLGTKVDVEESAERQIFVPTNLGTNTFVFDTVSFLSILTLAVFLVRVFSRVIR